MRESQTFRETSIIFLGSSEASRGWPLNRDNKCTAADCLLQQRTGETRLVLMSHMSRHLWSLDNSETPDAAMISTTIATTSHDLWRCHGDSWWEGIFCGEEHLWPKNRTQTGGIVVSGAKHTCIMPLPLCSSSHEDPWVKRKDAYFSYRWLQIPKQVGVGLVLYMKVYFAKFRYNTPRFHISQYLPEIGSETSISSSTNLRVSRLYNWIIYMYIYKYISTHIHIQIYLPTNRCVAHTAFRVLGIQGLGVLRFRVHRSLKHSPHSKHGFNTLTTYPKEPTI